MTPQRIISLVPSQTELLFDLGLDAEIVGLTKFCIHPADKVRGKTIVGGTKNPHLDRIHDLRPDLIIANKEENTREPIEELQQRYPVHVTDVVTLPDALAMIQEVGTLVGREQPARALVQQIRQTLPVVRQDSGSGCGDFAPDNHYQSPDGLPAPLRVAYFIWRKPYMVAAGGTFIDAMLSAAGFGNAFAGLERYPDVTPDAVQAARPDLVFLSSEPYPFSAKHRAEFRAICPSARVLVVDGEVFSWYGSRLLRAADYFMNVRKEIARLA